MQATNGKQKPDRKVLLTSYRTDVVNLLMIPLASLVAQKSGSGSILARYHMRVEFVVGSRLFRRVLSGPGFPPSTEANISNF